MPPRMQTVTVPGTAIRAQVPASYSDDQVRRALATQYKKATGFKTSQAEVINPKPLNRPIPRSNEEYWQQRLAGQGSISAAPETVRSRIAGGVSSLAGLATNPRHAAQIGEKVAGAADWVPGLGDAMGLQEAWGDLKRGVNTADPYTVGAAMLTGAATLLPGALDKPVRRGLGELLHAEDGAIRAFHGTASEFDQFDRIDGGNANGQGYYFTTDPAEASAYAMGDESTMRIAPGGNAGPNVRPVELDVTNPFDGRNTADRKLMSQLAEAYNKALPWAEPWSPRELLSQFDRPAPARDVLQTLTYDPDEQNEILKAAGFDARLAGYRPNDVLVWDKNKIKPAFGR